MKGLPKPGQKQPRGANNSVITAPPAAAPPPPAPLPLRQTLSEPELEYLQRMALDLATKQTEAAAPPQPSEAELEQEDAMVLQASKLSSQGRRALDSALLPLTASG